MSEILIIASVVVSLVIYGFSIVQVLEKGFEIPENTISQRTVRFLVIAVSVIPILNTIVMIYVYIFDKKLYND